MRNIQTSSHAIELRKLVRVANATSFHLYQNLPVGGKSQLNLLDDQRPAVLLEGGLLKSLGEAHSVIFWAIAGLLGQCSLFSNGLIQRCADVLKLDSLILIRFIHLIYYLTTPHETYCRSTIRIRLENPSLRFKEMWME